MEWYYQLNGGREGPIDETTLVKLYEDRKISDSTLVWNENFEDAWKPLSQVGLTLPARMNRVPPPISPQEVNPPSFANGTVNIANTSTKFNTTDFLASPVTAQIVAKNFDTYRSKWEKLLAKSDGDVSAAYKKTSWNWAAFLFSTGWLFYRKLYLAGAVCFATQVILAIFVSKGPTGLIVSLVTGLLGNALYLQKTYKVYQTVSNIDGFNDRTKFIAKQGQTNIVYGIGSVVCVVIVAGILGFAFNSGSLLENDAACGSNETVKLVKQIVRNQMNKENLGIVFDMSKVSMNVDAIRTNTSTSKKSTCAAQVDIRVKMNPATFSNPNEKQDPEKVKMAENMISDKLKQDISYTSEYTDKGDSIYVTVEGLNFNVQ